MLEENVTIILNSDKPGTMVAISVNKIEAIYFNKDTGKWSVLKMVSGQDIIVRHDFDDIITIIAEAESHCRQ